MRAFALVSLLVWLASTVAAMELRGIPVSLVIVHIALGLLGGLVVWRRTVHTWHFRGMILVFVLATFASGDLWLEPNYSFWLDALWPALSSFMFGFTGLLAWRELLRGTTRGQAYGLIGHRVSQDRDSGSHEGPEDSDS